MTCVMFIFKNAALFSQIVNSIKFLTNKCVLSRSKCIKTRFRLGLRPDLLRALLNLIKDRRHLISIPFAISVH